jgi:hypothetical protein
MKFKGSRHFELHKNDKNTSLLCKMFKLGYAYNYHKGVGQTCHPKNKWHKRRQTNPWS